MSRTLVPAATLKTPYGSPPANYFTVSSAPSDPVNGNFFYVGNALYTFLIASVMPPDDVWGADSAYTVGQVVSYVDNNFYQCIQANTNQQPDTSPTYWGLYAGETVTVHSVPDDLGRTGDITNYALPMYGNAVIQMPVKGWQQIDGSVYVDSSSARLLLGVIQINS